jgi:hypothetical protein
MDKSYGCKIRFYSRVSSDFILFLGFYLQQKAGLPGKKFYQLGKVTTFGSQV